MFSHIAFTLGARTSFKYLLTKKAGKSGHLAHNLFEHFLRKPIAIIH